MQFMEVLFNDREFDDAVATQNRLQRLLSRCQEEKEELSRQLESTEANLHKSQEENRLLNRQTEKSQRDLSRSLKMVEKLKEERDRIKSTAESLSMQADQTSQSLILSTEISSKFEVCVIVNFEMTKFLLYH